MAKRLPQHLKGPFVCSSYDINNATLYLKQPDGQYVSTITYPAFFIKTKEKSRFPFDEFGKYVLEQYNEGEFTRFTYDPTLRYEDRRVMVEICESEHVELYEADASATRRFFSDTGALVAQKFRSLMFDLETDPLIVGFTEEAIKTHRIISFAAYDCDDPSKSWYYAVQESTNEEEAKLLHYFQQIIKPYDTLLAWNGDGYDFVVLKERAKRAKIRINWRDWNLLDYMRVVKKLLMSVTDTTMKRSFALDAIGENVLGIRKIQLKVKYKHIATLLQGEENRRHLEEYNRHDVVIMTTLDQKREFLSLHYALCSFCRTFPGHPSIFPNELADGILLRLAVQEGKHFPTRKGWDVDDHKKKYEGAWVADPVEGFHLNVQVPDFASLYPSIIISWNMSNETMIQENQPYPFGIESYLATATATGVKFRTDIEGIIPKALKQLIIKRKEYKVRADASPVGSEEWKSMNNLSTAVKVVTNSFYGLLGNDGSRYYARDIARSVTLSAQLLIRNMMEYFNRKGYQAVYGDSITGTRTTFIKQDNHISVVTFEELWTLAAPFGIHVYHGDKECIYPKDILTLSRDKFGNSIWSPIVRIIRHKTTKDIYHLSHTDGQTEVTADHSISVNNNFVTPEKLIEMNCGPDTIPAIPEQEVYHLDIYEYLRDKTYQTKYKGRYITYRFVPCGSDLLKLEGWPTPGFVRRYYEQGSNEWYSLLRLMAAYITEGSACIPQLTTSRWMFSISQDNQNWLNIIRRDFETVFPCVTICYPKQSVGASYIRSGTSIPCLFMSLLCGYKSSGKRLPAFAYNFNDHDAKFFINELMFGDGYHTISNQWRYTTNSMKLTAGISYLMSQHQILHSMNYRPDKNAWNINTRTKKRNHWLHKLNVVKRQAQDEYVYDLEVQDSHTFVDGIGRVVLHNTDSAFIKCSIEEMKSELEYINKTHIPNLLQGFGCATCSVKLEFDKSFATLLLVTKKRYVGRLALSKGRPAPPDMEPEIKGIEVQRSDETRYGQRLLKEFIMMLIEKDCDPIQVERKLRIEGEKFYATTLTREELEITKSVSRKPEDYPSKPTAVKVAEQLIAEGEEFFIGMKIPYIVIEHDPYVKGIHADKYEGKYDKVYYWEHKILPPIQRLLDARFPKYPFKSFKNPNQMALDFFAEPEPCLTVRQPKVRIPKIMAQTIKLPEEKKIRMPVAKITVEGTNPDVIKGIARVAKVYPGKFKLKLDLKLGSGVTTIDTNDSISMEGLKQIQKLFPAVQIAPAPL